MPIATASGANYYIVTTAPGLTTTIGMRLAQGPVLSSAAQRGHAAAWATLLAGLGLGIAPVAQAKPFEEYIKPTPIGLLAAQLGHLGVAGVLPRDLSNGIESAKGAGVHPDYYYWDGEIIKAKDGKYHMFMSTCSRATRISAPAGRARTPTTPSARPTCSGPTSDKTTCTPTTARTKGTTSPRLELPDGSYAVVVSEIVPFTIYKSSLSRRSVDVSCCQPTERESAPPTSALVSAPRRQVRDRGAQRDHRDLGHPVRQLREAEADVHVYPAQPAGNGRQHLPEADLDTGRTNPTYIWQEDPHIWRSGGTYHVIYSGSGDRVGWHVYSTDGLTTGRTTGTPGLRGTTRRSSVTREPPPARQWYKMERPGVVLEDGHPTHITWAVADVDKDNQMPAGTNHGTKVIVVPFDGVAFDND